MAIYKYQRIVTPGPDGTTLYYRHSDTPNATVELVEIDGWCYVFVPDDVTMPEQCAEIQWQLVTLDADLRTRIKKASPLVQLIDQQIIDRIRAEYSMEDEQYFSRIGVGVALGAYAFAEGEQDALLAFGAYVESCRQWGRDQRKVLGL